MREGCDPAVTLAQHQKASTGSPNFQDALLESHDSQIESAFCKHYGGPEMYQGNHGGVMMHSFGPYHPHGGRHMPLDMYNVNQSYQGPQRPSAAGGGAMNVHMIGEAPEMSMLRSRSDGLNAMGSLKLMRRDLFEEEPKKRPPMDEASLQKRKRNRIAQKKYRERKKTESSRVQDQLETQKQQLSRMENLNCSVIEEHVRNAILTDLDKKKTSEIMALKRMLAELQDIKVKKDHDATGSTHEVAPCSEATDPELEGETEKGIVMDIVGAKFVEDMFPDVVRDMKTEVHGHIGCERRLPLLLNVIQERLLRSKESPHYSAVLSKSTNELTFAPTDDAATDDSS